jgi:hypothetical protein
MGVDRTDYVMFGVDISDLDIDWTDYVPEIEGAPDRKFDMVDDGMSGIYTFVGKILAKAEGPDGWEEPVDILSLIDSEFKAGKDSIAHNDTIKNIVEEFTGIKAKDFNLLVFTHFH